MELIYQRESTQYIEKDEAAKNKTSRFTPIVTQR
jgi:hypothetical protein